MTGEDTRRGGFRRSTDARIRVEKTVFPAAEPVPVVAYVVENEWPTPIAVQITDRVPDDVPSTDVGFRSQDVDDWTLREDDTIVYDTVIDEGSAARTAVFVRSEPFPEDAIRQADPVVTAVETVTPDGPSAADTADHDSFDAPDRSEGRESSDGDSETVAHPADCTEISAGSETADAETGADDGDTADAPDTAARSPAALEGEPPDELPVVDPADGSGEADPPRAQAGAGEGSERTDESGESLQVEPTEVTDGPSELRWEASTDEIDVNADASEVNFDHHGRGPAVGSDLSSGTLGRIERRLDEIEDAVERVEVQATNANITPAKEADAESEVLAILEECKSAARTVRLTAGAVRDHVDALLAVGRSTGTDLSLTRRDGSSVGQRDFGSPTDPLPGRDRNGRVDGASRAPPVPAGSGATDTRCRGASAERDGVIGDVRIEMVGRNGADVTGAENGHTAPGTRPPGGTARTVRYVDVRDLAMDEDEYTFDELVMLGSDLFA